MKTLRMILLAPFWIFMGDTSWIGAIFQSDATKSAADQQATAAATANTTQQDQFNTQQANIKPWLTSGTTAVNTLSAGLQPGGQFSTTPQFQFDQSKVTQDPGYAFRTQQGVDALTAAGAAGGNLGSGNMGTALINYGQQAGSQEYQSAYARTYQQQLDQYNSQLNSQNTIYNRLSGIAGTGQTASNQIGAAGQNMVNQIGNNLTNAATNIGNLGVQGANTIAGGFSNASNSITNQLMGGLQSYNYNNNLQQQQANNLGFGDAYSNSNGYGGVTGGSAAGTDMYAGNLY